MMRLIIIFIFFISSDVLRSMFITTGVAKLMHKKCNINFINYLHKCNVSFTSLFFDQIPTDDCTATTLVNCAGN